MFYLAAVAVPLGAFWIAAAPYERRLLRDRERAERDSDPEVRAELRRQIYLRGGGRGSFAWPAFCAVIAIIFVYFVGYNWHEIGRLMQKMN